MVLTILARMLSLPSFEIPHFHRGQYGGTMERFITNARFRDSGGVF